MKYEKHFPNKALLHKITNSNVLKAETRRIVFLFQKRKRSVQL